jgi:simple sugar transport system ATP-binding protein/ribose transport system ATP-binding protein
VQALQDVSLTIARAEIHALVGENGAGKSTLGKIIGGAAQPDEGTLVVSGDETSFKSPREALDGGIALVHQERSLAPALSVIDNIFLGGEMTRAGLVAMKAQLEKFNELAERTGFNLNPRSKVGMLRVSEQQKVEIMRALARDADLIVLDEPTAALTAEESSGLLDLIKDLRDRGTTFVYVSHYLEEVLDLADTVSVLKDGRLVSTGPAASEDVEGLVAKMLGRSIGAMFPDKRELPADAPVRLRVNGLSRAGALQDVSFEIRAGEIVGMAGLVGSGRSEVAHAIFGADPIDSGTIEIDGKVRRIRSPNHAVKSGLALVPESRKEQGLVMNASVRANLTLVSMERVTRGGLLRMKQEQSVATRAAEQVDVRMANIDLPVAMLSGGNQQKVAIGKWLLRDPSILIADEPTRGVDVGARSTIYQLIQQLADSGLGVLLISSELEEVMGLANRILVMHRGRLVAELAGDAQEDHILHTAFGGDATAFMEGAA